MKLLHLQICYWKEGHHSQVNMVVWADIYAWIFQDQMRGQEIFCSHPYSISSIHTQHRQTLNMLCGEYAWQIVDKSLNAFTLHSP